MAAHQQQLAALAVANEVRLSNVAFVRRVRTLSMSDAVDLVAGHLESPDLGGSTVGAMPIVRLLLAIPRFGPDRVNRMTRTAGITFNNRRARDLTDRQREHLIRQLRGDQ